MKIFRGVALCAFAILGLAVRSAAQTQDVSGKWTGIFDVVHQDGSVDPGSVFFSLSQKGSLITGSAGNAPEHLSTITSGTLAANTLQLSIRVNPQQTVSMRLVLEGDHLRGSADGLPEEAGSSIVIDAVRADANWKAAAGVPHVTDRLFQNVAALDKKLFEAYNSCDLDTLASLVSEDLEFYHDKTGLAVGRRVFVDAIRNNICGKVQRVLVPGTLEVHRLDGYGAVEIGVHTFHHPHDPGNLGIAKFITIWRFKNGAWQMTRAISYDHEPLKK